MNIPKDPVMLMSMVNMKMRDGGYDSLDDLCKELGIEENELVEQLGKAGFDWMAGIKQFR